MLVAQRLKYKEVADRLCRSACTIKFHRAGSERLHVKNRTEVIEYAQRTGLLG